MTELYVVRHGQTYGNIDNLWCGHAETELTPLGIAQARATGRRLAHVPFAAAYASDLTRTHDTARHVLEGRNVPLQLDPRLREMYYGEWEARSGPEVEKEQPERLKQFFRCQAPAPGGESFADLRHRTKAAIFDAVEEHRGEAILVVSHGNAIMGMLAELLGLASEATWSFALDNCSLTRLHISRRGRATVFCVNDTAHTQGLGEAPA